MSFYSRMDKLRYVLLTEHSTDEDLSQLEIFKKMGYIDSEIYKPAFCKEESIQNCYSAMTIKGNHIPLWDGDEITLV